MAQQSAGGAEILPGHGGSGGFSNQAIRWASRNARILAPFTTLIVLCIFFTLSTDVFLTRDNLLNVVSQIGPIAVAATGITFVLLCAEIDLSIASVATFAGTLATYFWVEDRWSVSLGNWAVLIGLGAAVAIGLFNGFCVAYIGIPSFMTTLAMLSIAHGASIQVLQGKPIFKSPPLAHFLGSSSSRWHSVPWVGVFALGVLIVAEVVLSYTRFGRYVYMTGGNREAAEMSGVNTRQITMACMTISSLTAGMCGVLYVGRLNSANPSAGADVLISSIAAVVLGGTSLFGGEGGIKNTVLGLLIFGILSNGLNLLPYVSIYFKEALQGLILVAALLLNVVALRLEKVQTRAE